MLIKARVLQRALGNVRTVPVTSHGLTTGHGNKEKMTTGCWIRFFLLSLFSRLVHFALCWPPLELVVGPVKWGRGAIGELGVAAKT